MKASPRAHIYRMVLLLVVAVGGALLLGRFLVPASWDSENWHRGAALGELMEKPVRLGGNASCGGSECHEAPKGHAERLDDIREGGHSTVACESCHHPLASHVADGRKISDGRVERTAQTCLICHAERIGREGKVVAFSPEFRAHKAREITGAKYCGGCHDPHFP